MSDMYFTPGNVLVTEVYTGGGTPDLSFMWELAERMLELELGNPPFESGRDTEIDRTAEYIKHE